MIRLRYFWLGHASLLSIITGVMNLHMRTGSAVLGAVQTRSTNTNIGVCPRAILQTKGKTETRVLEFIYMLECTLNTSQKTLLKSCKFGGGEDNSSC